MLTQAEINKNYMDSPEAARMLNITDSRIRRLCLDGRFEGAIKAGKSWLIPRIAVGNFKRLAPGKKPPGTDEKELLLQAINEANNLNGDD